MAIILTVSMVSSANAGNVYSQNIFDNYTGKAGTARESDPFLFGSFTKKSVTVGGRHASGAFAPYTGLFALVGSQTTSGPWCPLKDRAGNVITATGNATFDLDSAVPWVKAIWTRTKHRITVYINYSE